MRLLHVAAATACDNTAGAAAAAATTAAAHRIDIQAQSREFAQVASTRFCAVVGHKHQPLALQALHRSQHH